MSAFDFNTVLAEIIDQLKKISQSNPKKIKSCKNGGDFEVVVKDCIDDVKKQHGYTFEIDYKKGSHRFPDIILITDSGKYGIEVKSDSSNKSWKTNGNSILGSTRAKDVKEIYIIFGQIVLMDFKYRPYAECVSDIVVTHSPRYMIDMELEPDKNFFAESKIPYESLTEDEDPISRIASFYRDTGRQAWWITDTTAPVAIRKWSSLSSEEKNQFYYYAFAHFPEIFSNRPSKYERIISWLIATKSVIATRDSFSAGGKVTIVLKNGKEYKKVPHVYSILQDHSKEVKKVLANKDRSLYDDWRVLNSELSKPRNYTNAWIKLVAGQMGTKFLNGDDPIKFIQQLIEV